MPEYEHVYKSFEKGGSAEIPDEAIGVTTDTFAEFVTVHYLVPTEGVQDA